MNRTPAEIATLYDSWHAQLGPDEGVSPWNEELNLLLGDLTGSRCLEIGCGRGGFTAWLADRFPIHLVAADISALAVAQARALSPSTTGFTLADIEHIPTGTASLDLVVSCETIEHVPHPAAAVASMARLLRPGDRLLLTTTNYLGSMVMYRAYVRLTGREFTEGGQPITQLTSIPKVALWIRRAGLRINQITFVGHHLPWPGRPPIRLRHLNTQRSPLRWLGHPSVFVAGKPREPGRS